MMLSSAPITAKCKNKVMKDQEQSCGLLVPFVNHELLRMKTVLNKIVPVVFNSLWYTGIGGRVGQWYRYTGIGVRGGL